MPSKTDTMTVVELGLPDRRIKLTPEDKARLFDMHRAGASIHSLAKEFGVSRRLVQFVLFPERVAAARNGRTWADYYDTEQRRISQREHRAYKRKGGLNA